MSNYIICPKCDLNFIKPHEKCCIACSPEMQGKLLSDAEEKHEAYRQKKLKEYQAHKESMETFYAIRYNRKPK